MKQMRNNLEVSRTMNPYHPTAWMPSLAFALLFAAGTLCGSVQANTLGIDEVTSLRSTDHTVLEAGSDELAEAEITGEADRLAHWLMINDDTKWQYDEEVLALNEHFFNTNYAMLETAMDDTAPADTLALFFEVQDAKTNGMALQPTTAKK
jgi:hypothetical protein